MHQILIRSFAVVSAVLLVGCLTAPTQNTASGDPEVTVPGKTPKAILGVATNEFVNQGYTIRSRSELDAVFEKKLEGAVAFMRSGPGLAPPVYRVTLNFVESDAGTRVLGKLNVVSNPGGGKVPERVSTALDAKEHSKLQMQLNAIRDKMTGRR